MWIFSLAFAVSIALLFTSGFTASAGQQLAAVEAPAAPESGTDPLRCTDRASIPAMDQALETKWAPDSTQLAVTRIATSSSRKTITGFEEDPKLDVLDLKTGTITSLGLGNRPQWSQDGVFLSFWRGGYLVVQAGWGVVAKLEATVPEVRWVGQQLIYFQNDKIRVWDLTQDVILSRISRDLMPRYPSDWVDFSADGALFTLTRYYMDGRAERYVGQTGNGQTAPLVSEGTTYTEWAPVGETLLLRSDSTIELRGEGGFKATASVTAFPGRVHGWTADGKLLMGKVTPTVPVGASFDSFAVWDGSQLGSPATLPNLLGSRTFSPDGKYFAGVARNGLYETALEVYRCGAKPDATAQRAETVSRARQSRLDSDPRRFVRPVAGYITQFRQGSHTGIDIAAPFGSIITAADDGVVTFVGWRPSGGRAVCVQHADGVESCYYHSSQAVVSVGQRVARGEPIILIGLTGLTTGPHVHWEVKRNGIIIDPFRY